MKRFEIPMVVTSLVGLCFLAGLDAPAAHADFAIGAPASIESALPRFDGVNDCIDCFSADGLEMYIESNRAGGQGKYDLWVYRRASVEDDWGPPVNLGPAVNSAGADACPSITADGLELYFCSDRPGGYGGFDVYVTRRGTRDSPWGPPTNLGAMVNASAHDWAPAVSWDGLELYVVSNRPGGYGGDDIYVSKRATTHEPWGDPVNLGPAVNSPAHESDSALSPDGLLLIFRGPRPGGYGGIDVWMSRRAGRSAPWQPAVNLGPTINSPEHDLGGRLAHDGAALYFSRSDYTYWRAPIIPILDFNSDGKVDAKDMALLMADWDKSNSVCDIGPFAWGDGLVDEKDLKALTEAVVTPGPRTADVSCDVILRWLLSSLTPACDVYLGTSREAVTNADRAHPQGVLVSKAQTANTYDPEGPLEFSRTYYWRVDFVAPGPTPTIYKGPVLSFTTEAFSYPIKNISATASSSQTNMGPEKTVDGSGLDKNDGHSTNRMDMWLSTDVQPRWIQYEFDKVHALHELWVWNSNQLVESFVGFGAKTVKVEYSINGTKWTALAHGPEFARAPGQPGYLADTKVSFNGVSAKYVKLTIEKNWGPASQTGLSEVRFFYIPEKSTAQP